MPLDISKGFCERFNAFLDESVDDIKEYFSVLLTFKRWVFSMEFGNPVRIAKQMERFDCMMVNSLLCDRGLYTCSIMLPQLSHPFFSTDHMDCTLFDEISVNEIR